MKPRLFALLALLAVALVGCATRPENIAAAPVPESTYSGWTEERMRNEQEQLATALEAAAQKQHRVRANDTASIWVLGLPLSSMSGDSAADQIRLLKGQLAAIRKAGIAAGYRLPEVNIGELTTLKVKGR